MNTPGSIPLRILLPAIIGAAFLADVGARFMVPPSALSFRAWEAAELNRTASPGLFTPDFLYDNDRCYGDLANLANLPSMRQYHREFFTTDHFGFRNTPVNAARPVTTIIFGDSYTAGSGLSDHETLPSQLASIRGEGVYNGGGVFGAGCWQRIEQVIERLHLKHGVVIYEHAARYDAPSDVGAFEESRVDRTIVRGQLYLSRMWMYSPLQILAMRQFNTLRNDVVLPASRSVVMQRKLRNGRPILFLKTVLLTKPDSRAEFFVDLQYLVRRTGNELLVVLTPDKYDVYSSLVDEREGLPPPPVLSGLVANLKEAGVPVVDLTAALRDQAAALIAQGRYNYAVDDTHWNSAGVRCAAETLSEPISKAMQPYAIPIDRSIF